MTTTEKIIAVVLEEVNGYSKEDAEKYAGDCRSSSVWERIDTIVNNAIKEAKKKK